jgi:hypothetical protein
MPAENSASAAFGIVSQVTRILDDAVREGRVFTSEVSAGVTKGTPAEATGAYEIRISVKAKGNDD